MSGKNFLFKILVAGDASVGKTSILRRFVDDMFDESSIMTVGVDFFLKNVEYDSITSCSLQLWDLGGQERFRHLMPHYVMGARGALLLIDLSQALEIERILDWVNIIRLHDLNLPILLVGTKLDLYDIGFGFTDNDALELMETFNLRVYIKTSAKSGHNVKKVFDMLTETIMEESK